MNDVPRTMDEIGRERPASRTIDGEAAALAAALAQSGHVGPIFLVADNPAVTRSGPAWARAFAPHGWLHRVRVSTGIDAHGAALTAEAHDLALEARSLQATVIVAIGDPSTCAAARSAAALTGLPAVVWPAQPADAMPSGCLPAD